MPRFAANVSLLWPELEVYERFAAAAAAGFRRVEILFVHDLDLDRVAALLGELQLDLVLFDPRPGDWAAGERGLLSLPGRDQDFLDTVSDAIAMAQRLGTRRLNCLAGCPPPGTSADAALQTAIRNLQIAAPVAALAGITLLVENINTSDMPGYFAATPERVADIVLGVNEANVRMQLDQYHVGMMGGDARQALRDYRHLIEHVQIADVPGRHQPGTGHQPIQEFLTDLDALGYTGSVGLEYRPSTTTDAALAWLPTTARG